MLTILKKHAITLIILGTLILLGFIIPIPFMVINKEPQLLVIGLIVVDLIILLTINILASGFGKKKFKANYYKEQLSEEEYKDYKERRIICWSILAIMVVVTIILGIVLYEIKKQVALFFFISYYRKLS